MNDMPRMMSSSNHDMATQVAGVVHEMMHVAYRASSPSMSASSVATTEA
jgi:hypothetical protein